jgi:hypothetical protein
VQSKSQPWGPTLLWRKQAQSTEAKETKAEKGTEKANESWQMGREREMVSPRQGDCSRDLNK